MAYRNTLHADAVEGELPEDGRAAFGDDGGDLMLALARTIVAGEAEDGSVERVFARARQPWHAKRPPQQQHLSQS